MISFKTPFAHYDAFRFGRVESENAYKEEQKIKATRVRKGEATAGDEQEIAKSA